MKHTKKLASLLLALALAFALAVPAFAAGETYSITINNATPGHTYEAYQIFTGDLHETTTGVGESATTTKVLSNIVWGSGISEDGKTALQNKYDTAATKSAAGVAKALTTGNAVQFAKDAAGFLTTTKVDSGYSATNKNYVISGLAAGYYLVKDKDGSLTDDADAYTEYIVKVVSNTTATPKSSVPQVEKKVEDTNDSTGETSGWQDSADYGIGDSVPFQLKATLANNVSSYTTYKVVFHDTLSAGLTYNNDAVVKVGGTVVFDAKDGTKTKAGVSVTCEGNALTVTIEDVKTNDIGGNNNSIVTVDYTATLNDKAVVGSAGNSNKVKLEYSNNPNKSGTGGDNETGNTPEDTVIVFTYKVIINKVDGSQNALTGAEFTLEKYYKGTKPDGATFEEVKNDDNTVVGYWKPIAVVKNADGTTFTFAGLDDGDYRLTETKTPAGYNTIAPIEFTINAQHDIENANPSMSSLSGTASKNEITFTPNLIEGSLSSDVINNAGATLPETGGMGTTVFYVLGGVLVVGAVVLLITKKRMGAEH